MKIPTSDHTHADGECWVPVFVAWAEGGTDVLDFGGREVPQRVQDLLAALDDDHYLDVRDGIWTVQHPLRCRPDLHACPVTHIGSQVSESISSGRYRISVGDEPGWSFEPVPG